MPLSIFSPNQVGAVNFPAIVEWSKITHILPIKPTLDGECIGHTEPTVYRSHFKNPACTTVWGRPSEAPKKNSLQVLKDSTIKKETKEQKKKENINERKIEEERSNIRNTRKQ